MNAREAVVAGGFYPKNKNELEKQLDSFFKGLGSEKKSRCIVAPHAGYIYSGGIAAHAFNALQKAKTFVVLSPNHTGLGEAISVSGASHWETPLGKVEVDAELRSALLEKIGVEADNLAHIGEHSIEVQIPFIQKLFPKAKILPVTLMVHELPLLRKLGTAIYETGKGTVSVVASSDFTHGLTEEQAKEKDLSAVKLIEAMDISKFHKKVLGERLSICGFAPIVAAMAFAKEAGLKKGRLLKYGSSAETTGDCANVVGYAAIKFE